MAALNCLRYTSVRLVEKNKKSVDNLVALILHNLLKDMKITVIMLKLEIDGTADIFPPTLNLKATFHARENVHSSTWNVTFS